MEILSSLENQNPTLYGKCCDRSVSADDEDDSVADLFDEREVFGWLFWMNSNRIIPK